MASYMSFFKDLLWGSVLIYLLLGAGLYFSWRLNFLQIRHFRHLFTVMKHSRRHSAQGLSPFQSLCTGLAARVGTGNMAGVAIALTLGGPGAIFWMWLIAILGMATAFAESSLAQLYKTRDQQGIFRGGPAYYMEHGLGMRWMGILFSVLLIISFGLVFNAVQANAISTALYFAFGWSEQWVAVLLVVTAGVVIFGGLKAVARTTEVIVPFMAIGYVGIAFYITATHITEVPSIIMLIVSSAFGLNEAASGAMGYTIAQGVINGLQRGLFSNEAGMGSAPNAAASADPYPPHPASQGYVQMLGVFVDTLVICSATVAVILLSGEFVPGGEVSGIELTQRALTAEVGSWGGTFIAIAILFFAFTSVVANYAYAETNFLFLGKRGGVALMLFRVGVLFMVWFGSIASLPTVWTMADASMGLMAIVNLLALFLLSGTVVKLANDYWSQWSRGKVPHFDPSAYPELYAQIDESVWGPAKGGQGKTDGSNRK
ncbi:alanine/glycine:cation symporter family protein [Thaumasiovibrio subtropicus]|uniref:alanine/glycine:cation symporter family protein n=1 Tax=Thaumasiovibrio subtropicus TaxID=1891207 RepID=UPI000B355ADD|nr:alanine/glycine:cation symporter family protein [Thaumasiovibrio subtropicus]